MRLTVVGRHFEVTEPIKKYVDKKLLKLDRFARKIKEAHVILEVQKIRHIAEITLYLKYAKITATEETASSCPSKIFMSIPLVKSQRRTVLSLLPVTANCPSGVTVTELICP